MLSLLYIAIIKGKILWLISLLDVSGSNMIKAEKSPLNDLNLWEPMCLTKLTAKQQQTKTTCKSMLCMNQICKFSNMNEISKIVYKHLQDQTTEVIIRVSGVPLFI